MKNAFFAAAAIISLSACVPEIPSNAYFNRGDPENLIEVSSEVISLTLAKPAAVNDLKSMITQDPPARAELGCMATQPACAQAKALLDKRGIPTQYVDDSGTVSLVYERISARDCQSRYVNNSSNVNNLNHPTLGCSVTANTVQQVSDKRQFTSPSLMDFPDGEKAVQNYRGYLEPSSEKAKAKVGQSNAPLLSTINSGSGMSR